MSHNVKPHKETARLKMCIY